MPSVEQVKATLPSPFKEKFATTTFAIIDGSEVFIETPSDLFMQLSTWSQINIIILSNSLLHAHEMEVYASLCMINI